MPQQELIELALARIRNGAMPCVDIQASFAGNGRGTVCNVCQTPITEIETEFEVALKPVSPENPKLLHFHLTCYEAWSEACRRWRNKSELE